MLVFCLYYRGQTCLKINEAPRQPRLAGRLSEVWQPADIPFGTSPLVWPQRISMKSAFPPPFERWHTMWCELNYSAERYRFKFPWGRIKWLINSWQHNMMVLDYKFYDKVKYDSNKFVNTYNIFLVNILFIKWLFFTMIFFNFHYILLTTPQTLCC